MSEILISEKVGVDSDGYVTLDGKKLAQAEAIELAADLAVAVQRSIYRNQTETNYYRSTEGILSRMNSPLGRAITALRKVYG